MRKARLALVVVMTSAAGVCAFSACGRMAVDGDAGAEADADAGAALVPCTTGPFTSVAAMADLNTPDEDERGLRFMPDELVGVFSRTGNLDGGGLQPIDIYEATRHTRYAPFDGVGRFPTDVTEWPAAQLYPSITTAKTLFSESDCIFNVDGWDAPGLCVFVPVDAGNPAGFVLVGGMNGEPCGPFGPPPGRSLGDGFVTPDAGAYYFAALTGDDGGLSYWLPCGVQDSGTPPTGQGVFVAHRPPDNPAGPFGGSLLRLASDPTLFLDDPVLTDDQLTLYASATTTADSTPHVYTATRATTSDAFGAPTPLHELDSPEGEYPSWISPDRCRLYLTRKVGGQWDLYVASRSP